MGVIYRSPDTSCVDFCIAFDHILHIIANERNKLVIVGDINTEIHNTNSWTSVDYLNCQTSYGLSSLISFPTQVVFGGSSVIIDHIFTNISNIITGGVIPTDITDHYAVFVSTNLVCPVTKMSTTRTYFDYEKFICLIAQADWNDAYRTECAETAYNKFSIVMKNAISLCTQVLCCHKHPSLIIYGSLAAIETQ